METVTINGESYEVERAEGAGPLQHISVRRGLKSNMYFLNTPTAAQAVVPNGWYALKYPDGYLAVISPGLLERLVDE